MKPDLLVILGPTASGKTRIAVAAARALNGEVISADSRQVYRGMDIGTGKDLHEYGEVPLHLVDIADPREEFSLYDFQRRFLDAFVDIRQRGRLPILAGGTGLYLDAVLNRYELQHVPRNPLLRQELEHEPPEELQARLRALNPSLHNTTDLLDRERLLRAIEIASAGSATSTDFPFPELHPLIFGIRRDREALKGRITARLRQRLAEGMVEEVERLQREGVPWERLERFGLEYRYVARFLQGGLSRNDMFQKLNSAIHDFAKKQESWFRRMERSGISIVWLEGDADPESELLRHAESAGLAVRRGL